LRGAPKYVVSARLYFLSFDSLGIPAIRRLTRRPEKAAFELLGNAVLFPVPFRHPEGAQATRRLFSVFGARFRHSSFYSVMPPKSPGNKKLQAGRLYLLTYPKNMT
jgi:hypothetical protein